MKLIIIKKEIAVFLPKEMAQENILVTTISRDKTNHLHWFIVLEEIVNKNVFQKLIFGDFNKTEFIYGYGNSCSN